MYSFIYICANLKIIYTCIFSIYTRDYDHLEIILKCRYAAQETFLITINVDNSCAA